MLGTIHRTQIWLSHAFDRLLPESFRIDGNRDYQDSLVWRYIKPGQVVYDVGGGKNPLVSPQKKRDLKLAVVGIDIDQAELDRAPAGGYDRTVCADITEYRGSNDADVVVSQAVLEHVKDVDRAFQAIDSILRPGGVALLFVPSRHAVYAHVNRMLSEDMKKRILRKLYPESRHNRGFPSYYDRCSPREFRALAERNGMEVVEERAYYISSYFSHFFPAYVLWRIWLILFRMCCGRQAAETFAGAYMKPPREQPAPPLHLGNRAKPVEVGAD